MKIVAKKMTTNKLSRTRKATIKKKKETLSNKNAINATWRPKAKSKRQRELQALRSHPRRERSTQPCARVVNGCKKLALKNSLFCARHHDAGYAEVA